ncbi:hypothetical protein H5410_001669 [Solanum commersonii]|uniref:Uncharacterized protein n=1 Tax=Solanum commersonii TaxID=4109 RepID=A0A9J6AZP0_SOLCO|nr:hypothetical protein H5410_001669 [Solanum commersonii]
MWPVHYIIATDVFKKIKREAVDEAWRNTVLQPCLYIVKRFLKNDDHNIININYHYLYLVFDPRPSPKSKSNS